MSVIDSREIREKAVPDLLDDSALMRFEATIWKITGRRLTPLMVDKILIAHEHAVSRAIAVALCDEPPDRTGKTPRRVVPW